MEQLAVRYSNCFFCDNFQESTQDSFIYPVILRNIISSVQCCIRRPCSDFMDMLRRLINCRIIIIIIIIIIITIIIWHVIVTSTSSARLPLRGATARQNQNKCHVIILWANFYAMILSRYYIFRYLLSREEEFSVIVGVVSRAIA